MLVNPGGQTFQQAPLTPTDGEYFIAQMIIDHQWSFPYYVAQSFCVCVFPLSDGLSDGFLFKINLFALLL